MTPIQPLLLAGLALGLSACTITTRPAVYLTQSGSNLISDLRPDRGEGSTYWAGEQVRIRLSTRAAGYVTLVALQPNGYSSTLVRNAYVPAGTTTFPRAQDGATWTVAPPRGTQYVRAIFTRVRPTTDLVLRGTYDNGTWNTATNAYVNSYAAQDRDVQETYFWIR